MSTLGSSRLSSDKDNQNQHASDRPGQRQQQQHQLYHDSRSRYHGSSSRNNDFSNSMMSRSDDDRERRRREENAAFVKMLEEESILLQQSQNDTNERRNSKEPAQRMARPNLVSPRGPSGGSNRSRSDDLDAPGARYRRGSRPTIANSGYDNSHKNISSSSRNSAGQGASRSRSPQPNYYDPYQQYKSSKNHQDIPLGISNSGSGGSGSGSRRSSGGNKREQTHQQQEYDLNVDGRDFHGRTSLLTNADSNQRSQSEANLHSGSQSRDRLTDPTRVSSELPLNHLMSLEQAIYNLELENQEQQQQQQEQHQQQQQSSTNPQHDSDFDRERDKRREKERERERDRHSDRARQLPDDYDAVLTGGDCNRQQRHQHQQLPPHSSYNRNEDSRQYSKQRKHHEPEKPLYPQPELSPPRQDGGQDRPYSPKQHQDIVVDNHHYCQPNRRQRDHDMRYPNPPHHHQQQYEKPPQDIFLDQSRYAHPHHHSRQDPRDIGYDNRHYSSSQYRHQNDHHQDIVVDNRHYHQKHPHQHRQHHQPPQDIFRDRDRGYDPRHEPSRRHHHDQRPHHPNPNHRQQHAYDPSHDPPQRLMAPVEYVEFPSNWDGREIEPTHDDELMDRDEEEFYRRRALYRQQQHMPQPAGTPMHGNNHHNNYNPDNVYNPDHVYNPARHPMHPNNMPPAHPSHGHSPIQRLHSNVSRDSYYQNNAPAGFGGGMDMYSQTLMVSGRRIPPMQIEVSPGVTMPFRGSEETWEAIALNKIVQTECLGCTLRLYCIEDAELVVCPECQTMSPAHPEGVPNGRTVTGLGLGFKEEQLVQWQHA